MAHEHNGFGAVVARIVDGGESADNALVVGDLLVSVEGDVEVNLERGLLDSEAVIDLEWNDKRTRISTRLPFRSTSAMESLLERDMLEVSWWYCDGCVSALCLQKA
jgi:hypothetical protein